MNKILIEIKKEIKENILPKYKFIKDYIIEKNYYPRTDYLGWYRHNSIFYKGKPIIRLNIPVILDERNIEKLPLHDILLTTILHEIGHAIQDYLGYSYNEKQAEDFAYFYWDFGTVLDLKNTKTKRNKNNLAQCF
jgi:hypothetical protein